MGNENTTTTIAVTAAEVQTLGQSPNNSIQVQNPMQLLAIAVEKGYDLDRMSKLMDLYERWQKMEAEKSFNTAMAEFKKNPPQVIKDMHREIKTQTGGTIKYNHASIGNLVLTVIPDLANHGFNTDWKTTRDEPTWIEITCYLTHKDGFTKSSPMGGAPDTSGSKNMIQARASTISYLKRYTFEMVTGLATNENEDDGKGGAEQHGKYQKTQAQPAAALENQNIAKMKTEALKILADLKKLGELSDEKYKKSVDWFKAAKKSESIEAQLKKIKAMLPPDQQPENTITDEIGKMVLQLADNDTVKASKILKDAIIFWNNNSNVEEKLEIISSRKQIKDRGQADGVLCALNLYKNKVVNQKNGNGAAKADPKPAQNVSQPATPPQKEAEAAI